MLLIFVILFSILFILYSTFCHKARCICHICIKTFYFLSFFQNFHHGFSPADICICQPEEILYSTMIQDTRVCSQIFHMQFFSHFPPHSVFFMYSLTLDSSPDLCVASHLKTGCKTGISSPADAGNVIRFSIGPVDSQ